MVDCGVEEIELPGEQHQRFHNADGQLCPLFGFSVADYLGDQRPILVLAERSVEIHQHRSCDATICTIQVLSLARHPGEPFTMSK